MPMRELVQEGLLGRGLIPIRDPVLIERYNRCLEDMGLEPTELDEFKVDRMGWSPEIAADAGDSYYLSHGEANPLAIVLTPEQQGAPIYFPMHSFDWALMEQWFSVYKAAITDLTRSTAIWLDFEEDVDLFNAPQDLLLIDDVRVVASTPCGLMDHAREQEALVTKWLTEAEPYLEPDLIFRLQTSAKQHGDLRKQHLTIEDLHHDDLADFYSRAFGGVFVFRSRGGEPLLLSRAPKRAEGTLAADYEALVLLEQRGYLEVDVRWWVGHLFRLKVIAESFLIDVLEVYEPDIDYASLNRAKRKGLIRKYRSELGQYQAFVRVLESLQCGDIPVVPPELVPFLMHPPERLPVSSREVLWALLTYVRGGRFVPLQYRHWKTEFVEGYTKEWSKVRRSWALVNVKRFYDIASKSSGLQL